MSVCSHGGFKRASKLLEIEAAMSHLTEILKTKLKSSGVSASAFSQSLSYLSSSDVNVSSENPFDDIELHKVFGSPVTGSK